mgnify:CR=1 FL=1|jgi:hypothetical protein
MSSDLQNLEPSTEPNAIAHGDTAAFHSADRVEGAGLDRLQALAGISASTRTQVDRLLALARAGLPRMYRDGSFGHTLRAVRTKSGWGERLEGDSLRYMSMVALGLACTDEATQRQILEGGTAVDLARHAAVRAETSTDVGAFALAAWAAAEAGRLYAATLFRQLRDRLAAQTPIPTVQCAWALIAGLAGRAYGDTSAVIDLARGRLVAGLSGSGLFPHMLPESANGRMRSHIACFADQTYPIQAFSRLHAASGDAVDLSIAEACADRICKLQGPDGQWWWHYDTRDGRVAEGYPVYSVHQHAMGPMALLELREAGGRDYFRPIMKGLRWLELHPEVVATLVTPEKGVIWRKVARREPNKAVRAVAAFTTALSPGLRVPALDMLFPPSRVDYECRPYELGWLLYAWLSGGMVAGLATGNPAGHASFSEEA